ncbi:MAG: PorP/SprF family type IX secretion system membrane protein [Aurantibacter sp.]
MKHGIKIIVNVLVLSCGAALWGQQLPQFTQYMYNTISINPAYTGSRGTLNVTSLHRDQWAGVEGNPQTTTVSVHSPLRFSRVGLGFSYINDNLGDENTNYFYGDFSYTVPVSREVNLSFGLKAGFTNYSLDTPDPNDPFFAQNMVQWSPNFGAGLYVGSNRWFTGISTPRILNTDLNNGEFEALERTSYYAISGLVMDLSPLWKFRPVAIAKFTNGAPASYDATASLLFNGKLWFGASYRFNDASNFGAFMDYQISKNIRIGYAYDLPRTTFSANTSGTHEILLIYELGSNILGGIKSPRYF